MSIKNTAQVTKRSESSAGFPLCESISELSEEMVLQVSEGMEEQDRRQAAHSRERLP